MREIRWSKPVTLSGKSYVCGFCGRLVGPAFGYPGEATRINPAIYICTYCQKPTFCYGEEQVPAPAYGNQVLHVPHEVSSLYEEARRCMSVSAYTAAVLACRKLLMNIAVKKNAPEGKSFLEYVDYLCDKGYVTTENKGWVDHIRKKGNEANHQITEVCSKDAEDLISFSEMLLKIVFEFPGRIPGTP